MSEIKGQLLGILLVLVVFGSVSVAVASAFKGISDKITEKAENPESDAAAEFTDNGGQGQGNLLTY